MKDDFGYHSYFDSGEEEERGLKMTLVAILILILWRGRGRIKDDFGCRSYFESVEEEEQENQRQLCLSLLF